MEGREKGGMEMETETQWGMERRWRPQSRMMQPMPTLGMRNA